MKLTFSSASIMLFCSSVFPTVCVRMRRVHYYSIVCWDVDWFAYNLYIGDRSISNEKHKINHGNFRRCVDFDLLLSANFFRFPSNAIGVRPDWLCQPPCIIRGCTVFVAGEWFAAAAAISAVAAHLDRLFCCSCLWLKHLVYCHIAHRRACTV